MHLGVVSDVFSAAAREHFDDRMAFVRFPGMVQSNLKWRAKNLGDIATEELFQNIRISRRIITGKR